MNVEDSRSKRPLGTLNVVGDRALVQPNKGKFKSANQSKFWNVVPTRNQTVLINWNPNIVGSSEPRVQDAEFDQMIDERIEMLKKLQSQKLNSIDEEELDENHQANAIQDLDSNDPDNLGFFIGEETLFHIGLINHEDVKLILDTGTSKSTV
ncbi:hypothetical protein PCASD_14466 [Puccinia coronata f. sp. avenae]|uniref:Uncharacterized protein n=1 Tax=Puccinia coronata f. sp. avenae TaxID=200324 RepID=A0A2N5U8J9_9BASI|nr:hypothetical protein PCASD_14466 [Puccinia coronata f. sp. avenae]